MAKEVAQPLTEGVLRKFMTDSEKSRIDRFVKKTISEGGEGRKTATDARALTSLKNNTRSAGEWQQVGTPENPRWQREVPAEDGGPAWTETKGQDGQVTRSRVVPAEDGGADWRETVRPDGDSWKTRRYTDSEGRIWQETIQGDNRWRQNVNAEELAKQKGPNHVLTIEGPNGPMQINVYGASQEELALIKAKLEALPPEFRRFTGDITVADDIGQILNEDGSVKSTVAGFGGRDGIIIDRSQMDDRKLPRVLYHEMGHVQDYNSGDPSMKGPPWGDGNATEPYGNTNNREDWATAHEALFQIIAAGKEQKGTPNDILSLTKEQIRQKYPHAERYIAILEQYGHQFPAQPIVTLPGGGSEQPPGGGGPPGFPPGGGVPPGFPPGGGFPPGFPPGGGFPPGFPPGGFPPGFPPGGGFPPGFPPGGGFPPGFPPGGFPPGFPPGGGFPPGFPPGGGVPPGFPPGGGFPPGFPPGGGFPPGFPPGGGFPPGFPPGGFPPGFPPGGGFPPGFPPGGGFPPGFPPGSGFPPGFPPGGFPPGFPPGGGFPPGFPPGGFPPGFPPIWVMPPCGCFPPIDFYGGSGH